MLVLHRRHVKDCPHQSRTYRKCACPIWFDWRIGNERVRKPMSTSEWQVAQLRAREMEATGLSDAGTPVTVDEAFKKFIADANARGLRKSTLRKYDLMHRNLTTFCQQQGLVFLRQLGVDQIWEFRNTWKLNARTAAKSLERLRSFFKFCLESDWIEKNPAKAIKAGKVEDADVLPFSDQEIEKILKACDTFNGNGQRIKALTQLMLASGLRIGDACTISREKFIKEGKDWKLYIPLQKEVVEAIEALPGKHPFWSGESTPENCSSVWQEAYRKLFNHAGLD
jgi:integrase